MGERGRKDKVERRRRGEGRGEGESSGDEKWEERMGGGWGVRMREVEGERREGNKGG